MLNDIKSQSQGLVIDNMTRTETDGVAVQKLGVWAVYFIGLYSCLNSSDDTKMQHLRAFSERILALRAFPEDSNEFIIE